MLLGLLCDANASNVAGCMLGFLEGSEFHSKTLLIGHLGSASFSQFH